MHLALAPVQLRIVIVRRYHFGTEVFLSPTASVDMQQDMLTRTFTFGRTSCVVALQYMKCVVNEKRILEGIVASS